MGCNLKNDLIKALNKGNWLRGTWDMQILAVLWSDFYELRLILAPSAMTNTICSLGA